MRLYMSFQHNYEHNNIQVYDKREIIIAPGESSI